MAAAGLEFVGGIFTRPAAFILSGFMAHASASLYPIKNHGELAVALCFVFLYMASPVAGAGASMQCGEDESNIDKSSEGRSDPLFVALHDGLASLAGGTPGDAQCGQRQAAVATSWDGTAHGKGAENFGVFCEAPDMANLASVNICTLTPSCP